MSSDDEQENDEEKADLTRIEDLSEYLHELDSKTDRLLGEAESEYQNETSSPPSIPDELLTDPEEEEDSHPEEISDDSDAPPFQEEVESSHNDWNTENNFSNEEETQPELEDGFENSTEEENESEFTTEDSSFENLSDEHEENIENDDTNSFEEGTNTDREAKDNFSEEQDFQSNFEENEKAEETQFEDIESNPSEFDDQIPIDEEELNFTSENTESETTADWQSPPLPNEDLNRLLTQELDEQVSPAPPESSQTSPSPSQENFQDLRDFGNSINYGVVSTGGNPPFSLILRRIQYQEDAHDILTILREHGLCSEDNEETLSNALQNGSLLLSQISEYSAIYLAHRLRRFDVDIQVGLSDELHPSKNYESENRGLVSKYSLKQNIDENVDLIPRTVELESILLTTTPTLENYTIYRYIQVITSHTLIDQDELKRLHKAKEITEETYEKEHQYLPSQEDSKQEGHNWDKFSLGLNEVYKELASELRNEAYKLEANAVIGVNYQITPLVTEEDPNQSVYKITCTGNAVWVVGH